MVLPLRLIWNLQMRPNQKLSIGGLFCIGWVCIIAATIRVAQIGGNISKGQPAPSWLVLWGIIEASIGRSPDLSFSADHVAVIIGSAPGVYRIVKARVSQSRPSYYRYDSHGFHRATATATGTRSYGRDIALSPFPASKHSLTSSQENLASSTDRGNITVTSQVAVTVEDRDKLDGRGYIRFTGRGI